MMTVLSAVGHPSLFEEVISKKYINPTIFHALYTAFQFKTCQCAKNFQRLAIYVSNESCVMTKFPSLVITM